MIHELLADAPRARMRAIRDLEPSPALAYALRRVLFTDRRAEIRAAAARRLGRLDEIPAAAAAPMWLVDALADGSPLVRDAVLRALARCGATYDDARERVRARITDDRMWWVRRTAVYALAAIAGERELAAFEAALADPFWRVRHAAVKVLAALGARDLDVRARIRDDLAPPAALAYLRGSWGPTLVEAPQRAATRSALPARLLDPDPAVVTARLAADPACASPVALVEVLCDPHAPLRLLAAEIIAASGDAAAYEAALDWLEEARIPHAADTVERLLDGLGDPAAAIAARALARVDRPGAARWAIAWVAATKYTPLVDAALARARGDRRLRAAALPLATIADLAQWAEAAVDTDAIAAELYARRSPSAHAALLALTADAHPRARSLQVDAAARAEQWPLVERAAHDVHYGPRAAAIWSLRRAGRDVAAAASDADPAVREASIDPTRAAHDLDDADPWVVRAAARALRDDDPAVERALASVDPAVRAEACRHATTNDRAHARLLALAIDPDEAVRSAALAALAHVADVDAQIAAWLEARAASADDAATTPHIRADREPREPRAAIVAEHRAFGRAGFAIAPLVISGAYDLSPGALVLAADAGVDAWFWEPSYHGMTRFLRQRPSAGGARIIAGSYHAEPHAIEADIDRSLRQLRRETLDVFLLFWSRSPARVDADAFAALDRIRRSGKVTAIGFSTHDRALARAAIETSPWDVVMTRHSAAHPGIEDELLPTARAHDTAILTFSALCYGRMTSGADAPTAADCIRYSLSQPGVTACINAPRRRAEALARLAVLAQPTLAAERLAELRTHGVNVRAASQRFNALMRQPTRDVATAARELLAAELPPQDELEQRPLPRPSAARPSRTHLGKTRR